MLSNALNTVLFPRVCPNYNHTHFPGHLFYIPQFTTVNEIQGYVNGGVRRDNCIPCFFISPLGGSQRYLIYSHGNGVDLGVQYESFCVFAEAWHVNVIAYEYEGYGIRPGTASPESCNSDITTVYNFFTLYLNVSPSDVVIFGRSIGTGPSTFLVSSLHKQPAGLILQSPFTSISEMANNLLYGLGGLVWLFAPNTFDNLGAIRNVTCPTLFIHGQRDTLIPPHMSRVRRKISFPPFFSFTREWMKPFHCI
eukprot:TRINITY_DN15155_c0_g1_i1.p1 TRINITY_DN15155_c0_g1~~TRINITY_DN15155_c0_g1_i1.p1  ORF type:complete len:251 (-),score=19.46 TRINITY_DN15155_c0_g1_i1:525-1277(-)